MMLTPTPKVFAWAAAGLSLLWSGVHVFLGGPEIAVPLLASDLPDIVRAPAWMVWNMVTGVLLLMAALFGWGTLRADRGMLWSATALAGVLAIAGIVSAPLAGVSYGLMPQGFLFVPVAICGALAARG